MVRSSAAQVRMTTSRRSRGVPVPDRVLPQVRAMAAGREAEAPLFVTAAGHVPTAWVWTG